MANKQVKLKNQNADYLLPSTLGSLVINNDGRDLGGVEENAQVNVLEGVQLNGTDITIGANKKANIVLPAAVEYSIIKAATADAGMSATYQLAKDGVAFGTKINIAKDMVISGGELKKCTVADQPITGLEVGDPYLELTIANNDGTKLFIPVKDLVDVYTAADNTITFQGNAIKVNLTELQKTFYTENEIDTTLAGYQTLLSASNKLNPAFIAEDATHRFVTDTEKATWNGKQDAIADLATIRSNAADGKAAKDAVDAMGDIVSHDADEFQTLIDANNKLAASLVEEDVTHRFVTDTEKATWNGKQDAISDLATIRAGAAAGATALQQSDVVSTYSATGTAPINGTALAAALQAANYITYEEISA